MATGTPKFAVSSPGLTSASNDTILSIVDYTPYDTSGEAGHLRANFDEYLVFELTHKPTGNKTIYSAIGEGTAITPPSSNSTPFSFNHTIVDGDGVYGVRQWSVPTHVTSQAYDVGDIVYLNGVLYQASTGTSNNPPHADWTIITRDDIPTPGKYSSDDDLAVFIQKDFDECYTKYVDNALGNNCGCPLDYCNDKITQAATWIVVLREALAAAEVAVEEDVFADLINSSKFFCKCGGVPVAGFGQELDTEC